MISHLRGKIIDKNDKFLVLDVAGVGYKVFGTLDLLSKATLDNEISLWTHLAIRDVSHDLYGFDDRNELDFFEMLITISGIGPKSAMNILSIATLSSLQKAVSSGDASHLIKVSGIGKKNAEKIVLELKGKFEETEPDSKEEVDALEALKSLGYSYKEAHDALKKVSDKASTTSNRIKEALKILGK